MRSAQCRLLEVIPICKQQAIDHWRPLQILANVRHIQSRSSSDMCEGCGDAGPTHPPPPGARCRGPPRTTARRRSAAAAPGHRVRPAVRRHTAWGAAAAARLLPAPLPCPGRCGRSPPRCRQLCRAGELSARPGPPHLSTQTLCLVATQQLASAYDLKPVMQGVFPGHSAGPMGC